MIALAYAPTRIYNTAEKKEKKVTGVIGVSTLQVFQFDHIDSLWNKNHHQHLKLKM